MLLFLLKFKSPWKPSVAEIITSLQKKEKLFFLPCAYFISFAANITT